MGRRRNEDPGFIGDLWKTLLVVPIYVGPIIAVVLFAALRWLFPWALTAMTDPAKPMDDILWPLLMGFSASIAPFVGAGTLLLWVMAELNKVMDRSRLDNQTGIGSIRDLNWREFERLLSEAFRRQGYLVEECGGPSPDGGVDQRLTRDGETTLVQCKHWKMEKVGVKVVRELLGVMTSERAAAGIVVTSGEFSPEASAFARQNRITLINGSELERLIRSVQATSPVPPIVPKESAPIDPLCPKCGSPMIKRIAKRGANSGSQFWGCTTYPVCKGTRSGT